MRKRMKHAVAAIALGLLTAGAAQALDVAGVIQMQARAVSEDMIRTIILDCRLSAAPTAVELQALVNNGATNELLDVLYSPIAYGDDRSQQAYYNIYATGTVIPVQCAAVGYCPAEDVFFHAEEAPPVVQYVEPVPAPTVYYVTPEPTYYYEDYPYADDYYYDYDPFPSFPSFFWPMARPPHRPDRPDRPHRPPPPPQRPDNNRPGRPEPGRPPQRPGNDNPGRPGANRPSQQRPGNNNPGRPERPAQERPRPPSGDGGRVRPDRRPAAPTPPVEDTRPQRRPGGRNAGGRR